MTPLVVMLLTFLLSAACGEAMLMGGRSFGVTAETIRGPDNQVAIVRASATLKCSSGVKGCSSVEWLKTESGNSTSIYQSYAEVSEPFRERYGVDATVGCDLVIRDLTMADAGLFVCRIANDDSLSASLIVLESIPSCERLLMKPSGSETNSYDVAYHCALTFSGLVENATMTWEYSENGTQVERVPPQEQRGGAISRSYFRSTEQLSEDQPLRCVTRFRVPAERDRASNVPEVKCETTDRWQHVAENLTLTDWSPSSITDEEKKKPVPYIVVGAVVFALAIFTMGFCVGYHLC